MVRTQERSFTLKIYVSVDVMGGKDLPAGNALISGHVVAG